MIYQEAFDEVVTFEAYFKEYVISNEGLIIPYINIGVSNHPLNESNELMHLNYSYVVCKGIALVKLNGKMILDNMELQFGEFKITYLGGVNLKTQEGCEFQVLCKKAYLQTVSRTVMRKNFWIPVNRPTLKSNMDIAEAEPFLSLQMLDKDQIQIW
jgi:hypothetical protein